MYAILCTSTHFVQLAGIVPSSLRASPNALQSFVFAPSSVMRVQEMLGYGFMCLATLAAIPVFVGDRLER